MILVNIGFSNMVSISRIVSLVTPESAPVKRIISRAKEREHLVDATFGRKTKTVILTDTELVIISALTPETLALRIEQSVFAENKAEGGTM